MLSYLSLFIDYLDVGGFTINLNFFLGGRLTPVFLTNRNGFGTSLIGQVVALQ